MSLLFHLGPLVSVKKKKSYKPVVITETLMCQTDINSDIRCSKIDYQILRTDFLKLLWGYVKRKSKAAQRGLERDGFCTDLEVTANVSQTSNFLSQSQYLSLDFLACKVGIKVTVLPHGTYQHLTSLTICIWNLFCLKGRYR